MTYILLCMYRRTFYVYVMTYTSRKTNNCGSSIKTRSLEHQYVSKSDEKSRSRRRSRDPKRGKFQSSTPFFLPPLRVLQKPPFVPTLCIVKMDARYGFRINVSVQLTCLSDLFKRVLFDFTQKYLFSDPGLLG